MTRSAPPDRGPVIQRRAAPRARSRRGAVLVWFVFLVPLMMLILFGLTDYGAMTLARVQLRNATDAAALSAVKTWQQRGPQAAQADAVTILEANPVIQHTLWRGRGDGEVVATSSAAADSPQVVADRRTTLVVRLGYLIDQSGEHHFVTLDEAGAVEAAAIPGGVPCAWVQQTVTVQSLAQGWLGVSFGPYSTSAESFARLSPDAARPQLVFVDAVRTLRGAAVLETAANRLSDVSVIP